MIVRLPKLTVLIVVFFPAARAAQAGEAPVTCATCHHAEAEQLARSAHAELRCHSCHAGPDSYSLSPAQVKAYTTVSVRPPRRFDHGPSFLGRPNRARIPELCGNCHADVERMNPYGLRTDQLARYWTSGHGKTLKAQGDTRVAVCVDCHGSHEVLPATDTRSKTHPLNLPDTCATCHTDVELMAEYKLPAAVVSEYRQSVHGRLLLEQHDAGAPTCATCHGNHSAAPPGFASVGAVCGRCHRHAAKSFGESVHADLPEFKGCIQCHGGGADTHHHKIERITEPAGLMVQRYVRLLASDTDPTSDQISAAIHTAPRRIMRGVLESCADCHDEPEEDESLSKLLESLDSIAGAERGYVRTAARLDEVGRGVLLVTKQRFQLEDAKTYLVELAPLQHNLDPSALHAKIAEINAVCEAVNTELDELERGLQWRLRALVPVWAFAVIFAGALYVKYRRLKAAYVKPLPQDWEA